MKIPISKPLFGVEEMELIKQPLETGWVVQGPLVKQFEDKFAAYTGARHAAATTSCTTALHLAMVALGVGPGDEVIVPAFTWVATANVVESQGARPVFVDIDLETFNIDIKKVEKAITARTKVIMPVSLFGLSADMDSILQLANKRGIRVVEDDACGTGAWYKGQHAGTRADIGCFSFHPRKAITTGEGGMVITNDDRLDVILRSLRDHGASKSDLQRHTESHSYLLPEFNQVGYNYRMTDFQGAVGVVQMDRLEGIMKLRREIAAFYDKEVSKLGWLRPPITSEDCNHGYQSYVCLFQPDVPSLKNVSELNRRRNQLMDELEVADIATRPGTHAVHMLAYYRNKYNLTPSDFPNSYLADQLTLALPLYAQMTEEEQQYVLEHLKRSEP